LEILRAKKKLSFPCWNWFAYGILILYNAKRRELAGLDSGPLNHWAKFCIFSIPKQ